MVVEASIFGQIYNSMHAISLKIMIVTQPLRGNDNGAQ